MKFYICARVAVIGLRQGGLENTFSTLLGEKDNEPAVSIETENKFDNIINNHSLKKKKSILQTENLNRF